MKSVEYTRIYISDALPHKQRPDIDSVSNSVNLETVSCEVRLDHGQGPTTIISCCYRRRPPSVDPQGFCFSISCLFDAAVKSSRDFILVGDLNCDLLSATSVVSLRMYLNSTNLATS